MPLLFSYGTLQDPEIQILTFGRLLRGQADQLPGFALSSVPIDDADVIAETGMTHYANAIPSADAASHISGTVFEVTAEELASSDGYEEPAGYTRRQVTLASGTRVWVYSHPPVGPGGTGTG